MPEVIVYQVFNAREEGRSVPNIRINLLEGLALEEGVANVVPVTASTSWTGRISLKLAKVLAIVGIAVLAIYFAPVVTDLAKSALGKGTNYGLSGGEVSELTKAAGGLKARNLPAFDSTLPKTNRLIIPAIGVNTDIEEATYDNYESALKKGVWRVSNFGQPDTIGAPIILAAHRYGYLAWTNSFRHTSSFYNLPKVKVGDTITIDWQQREYTYGVYKVESGEEITDYSADIILYTCVSLNGPERVFIYAKLIS